MLDLLSWHQQQIPPLKDETKQGARSRPPILSVQRACVLRTCSERLLGADPGIRALAFWEDLASRSKQSVVDSTTQLNQVQCCGKVQQLRKTCGVQCYSLGIIAWFAPSLDAQQHRVLGGPAIGPVLSDRTEGKAMLPERGSDSTPPGSRSIIGNWACKFGRALRLATTCHSK